MKALTLLAIVAAVAAWAFCEIARRHAVTARDLNKDTKDTVAAWWQHVGPAGAPQSAKDMADALAERRDGERRHWGAGGR